VRQLVQRSCAHVSPSAERADVSEEDMLAREASNAYRVETCLSFAPVRAARSCQEQKSVRHGFHARNRSNHRCAASVKTCACR
jgi:hypothetical protein